MFTSIGHGYFLVMQFNQKCELPRIAKKIAQSAWGLFDISAVDLVLLRHAVEQGLAMPHLESLRCLRIARTRHKLAE